MIVITKNIKMLSFPASMNSRWWSGSSVSRETAVKAISTQQNDVFPNCGHLNASDISYFFNKHVLSDRYEDEYEKARVQNDSQWILYNNFCAVACVFAKNIVIFIIIIMATTKNTHVCKKPGQKVSRESWEKTVVIFFIQNNLPLLQTVIFILGENMKHLPLFLLSCIL